MSLIVSLGLNIIQSIISKFLYKKSVCKSILVIVLASINYKMNQKEARGRQYEDLQSLEAWPEDSEE